MTTPCCKTMADQLETTCDMHGAECPDFVVRRGSTRLFLVAPNAEYDMEFCPWCGTRVQPPRPLEE